MASLGWLYHSQGRYDEAKSLFVKALETGRGVVDDAYLCSLHSMTGLGTLYLSQGQYDQAERLLTNALETGRRAVNYKHPGQAVHSAATKSSQTRTTNRSCQKEKEARSIREHLFQPFFGFCL